MLTGPNDAWRKTESATTETSWEGKINEDIRPNLNNIIDGDY